jgi:hypothetical protein
MGSALRQWPEIGPPRWVEFGTDRPRPYLDDLRSLCDQKGLTFETVDRVLYVFDKETNGSLAKGKSAE